MQTAYLDNSATTRPCAAAVAAITDALQVHWHNPSSLYEPGIEAKQRLERARKQVAAALGAEPDRVYFTSGGTEADNWAIFSSAVSYTHLDVYKRQLHTRYSHSVSLRLRY